MPISSSSFCTAYLTLNALESLGLRLLAEAKFPRWWSSEHLNWVLESQYFNNFTISLIMGSRDMGENARMWDEKNSSYSCEFRLNALLTECTSAYLPPPRSLNATVSVARAAAWIDYNHKKRRSKNEQFEFAKKRKKNNQRFSPFWPTRARLCSPSMRPCCRPCPRSTSRRIRRKWRSSSFFLFLKTAW